MNQEFVELLSKGISQSVDSRRCDDHDSFLNQFLLNLTIISPSLPTDLMSLLLLHSTPIDSNSALCIILDGTTDNHIEMLRGGIVQKLLEEKWKTFGYVSIAWILMFFHDDIDDHASSVLRSIHVVVNQHHAFHSGHIRWMILIQFYSIAKKHHLMLHSTTHYYYCYITP